MPESRVSCKSCISMLVKEEGMAVVRVDRNQLHSELTSSIIGCAFDVINEMGSGFLESVYENAMVVALSQAGLTVQAQ